MAEQLESLFGYDALNAGLVRSPAGLFVLPSMPVIGLLLGRGTDALWLLAAGLLSLSTRAAASAHRWRRPCTNGAISFIRCCSGSISIPSIRPRVTLRQQQASALAYFDCFWMFAMVTLALVLVLPVMKHSVAEKGARIASE